jgi:hypothetical protein
MRLTGKIALISGLLAVASYALAKQGAAKPDAWVASWGASQQIPEPQNALPTDDMRDATLRQIVHMSLGGSALRVHLSNAFGTQSLHFTSVHVAHAVSPKGAAIDPTSDHTLTFAGKPDVTIPPGAEFVSDPLEVPVAPLSDIAVTFHVDAPPASGFAIHFVLRAWRRGERDRSARRKACGPLVPAHGNRCANRV